VDPLLVEITAALGTEPLPDGERRRLERLADGLWEAVGAAFESIASIKGGAHRRSVLIACTEYALTAAVLGQWNLAVTERIGASLASVLRRGSAVEIATARGGVSAQAWVTEWLARNGVVGPRETRRVKRLLAARGLTRDLARSPQRRYEDVYLLRRLALVSDQRASAADRIPPWPRSWSVTTGARAYEATHAVFWLSDFGDMGWTEGSEVLSDDRDTIIEALDESNRYAIETANLDLRAEVALARICLGPGAPASSPDAIAVHARGAQGVPSPVRSGPIQDRYHAALVSALALTAALRRRRPIDPMRSAPCRSEHTTGAAGLSVTPVVSGGTRRVPAV
jgi:hypothetical protein